MPVPLACLPPFGPQQIQFFCLDDFQLISDPGSEVLRRTDYSRSGPNSTLFFPCRKFDKPLCIPLSTWINVERHLHWRKRFGTHQASWCQASLCLSGLPGAPLPPCGWEQRAGSSVFEPSVSCLLVVGIKASCILMGLSWSNGADTAFPVPMIQPVESWFSFCGCPHPAPTDCLQRHWGFLIPPVPYAAEL